ncbi:ATP-binding protein [Methanosarcinales archaeon]|nr:MAG: ATP-binding protein [Methanosarcinales archaeon]
MTTTIAITGKGGTGKTAVTALLIRRVMRGERLLLAVDADPDTNLPDALGDTVTRTVGDVRELMLEGLPPDADKMLVLESRIYEILTETPKYDLLVMGRPDGPGCYCYANNLLRGIMDKVTKNYDLAIIDTAAGLEHLSRRIIRNLDILLVVTDGSRKGLLTAERIRDLAGDLDLGFKKIYIILNKVTPDNRESLQKYASELDFEIAGTIPFDSVLADYDLDGTPLIDLPDDSEAVTEVERIAELIGI